MAAKYTVAIIGCGRLGQHYAEVYQTLPNTEVVAIAEYNPERRKAVGERFGIGALYQDAEDSWRECRLHARNLIGTGWHNELLKESEQVESASSAPRQPRFDGGQTPNKQRTLLK